MGWEKAEERRLEGFKDRILDAARGVGDPCVQRKVQSKGELGDFPAQKGAEEEEIRWGLP